MTDVQPQRSRTKLIPTFASSRLRSSTTSWARGLGAHSSRWASPSTAAGGLGIEPYPDVEQPDSDDEEQSIALLYRHQRTFAIGHGCAADWDAVARVLTSDPPRAFRDGRRDAGVRGH